QRAAWDRPDSVDAAGPGYQKRTRRAFEEPLLRREATPALGLGRDLGDLDWSRISGAIVCEPVRHTEDLGRRAGDESTAAEAAAVTASEFEATDVGSKRTLQ